MSRQAYDSDVSDAEWAVLEPYIPAPKPGGRPAKHRRREIVNALTYLARAGCAWRLLPHDLPPWKTVYDYFRQWREAGLWEHINTALRSTCRQRAGHDPQPSAASIDSQSVKTTEKGGYRALMRARKSKAANGTLSWIPWACC